MDWEEPKPKPTVAVGDNLTDLSITELNERIEMLKSEIERIEVALRDKQSSQKAAEDVFKR